MTPAAVSFCVRVGHAAGVMRGCAGPLREVKSGPPCYHGRLPGRALRAICGRGAAARLLLPFGSLAVRVCRRLDATGF
jgi:hypothetical protein